MPVYSYRCNACQKISDILTGVSSTKMQLICEYCGSANIQKIVAAFSVGSASKELSSPCQSVSGGQACSGCPHGGASCSMV